MISRIDQAGTCWGILGEPFPPSLPPSLSFMENGAKTEPQLWTFLGKPKQREWLGDLCVPKRTLRPRRPSP